MSNLTEPTLKPASSGVYHCTGGPLTVHGHKRESLADLKKYVSNGKTQDKKAKDAKDAKDRLYAQLKLYDIACTSHMSQLTLLKILTQAIKEGKCDTAPPNLVELEKKLLADYKAREPAHLTALAAYREAVKEKHEQERKQHLAEFEKLDSPTAEAQFDLRLFLAKYFLGKHHEPDRSKTPDPIALPGFDGRAALHKAANGISGMETCSGGEGDSRTIVVGWNKAAVWGMAAQIGAKQAEEKHEKRKEEWGEVLEAHREFVKNNAKKSPKTFAYKNAVGSYAVLCEDISRQWSNGTDDMTVDIAMAGPLGLEAAFDFGLLEGTMLLADSTVKLELLRDEHEGSEKEDDEDEDDDEDDDNAGVRGGKKRQAPSVVPKARKAKSRKPNPAHPRRIYLQWRGRETQENEIQLDYDNSNTGYIDFTDNACTKFEGVASFSLVGEDVAFEGLKIGTTPQARAEPWSNFSEEEYESARVGRWH